MIFELIISAFVAAAAFSLYAYLRNPTILGSIGVSGAGAVGGYWIDTYSAFSARLADGFGALAGGAGTSVSNVLLAVGMSLMLGVFVMNAIVTALDGKKNNFTLVR